MAQSKRIFQSRNEKSPPKPAERERKGVLTGGGKRRHGEKKKRVANHAQRRFFLQGKTSQLGK